MKTNTVWESVTKDQLLELYVDKNYSDNDIAQLFGVTRGQVAYKRKKFELSREIILFKRCMSNQNAEYRSLHNEQAKQTLYDTDLSIVSRAIAAYIFREGPIEDMHAQGQLSNADMKTLNKYMNDRIATLLQLLKEQDWIRLTWLIDIFKHTGVNWDNPELQLEELDKIIEPHIRRMLTIGK